MYRNGKIFWITVVAILTTGVVLAAYVQNTTTKIQEALAEEVLQQQHDVANLMYEYAGVMLSVQRLQLRPDSQQRTQLENSLLSAHKQLLEMRSTYSFKRLDGAPKAHAFVRPILGDVEQWISSGIPGHEKNDELVLLMAAKRLSDRYPLLRTIAVETNEVATTLISTQSEYLEQFRSSLLFLFAGFSLLTFGISVLLVRQRNLQTRLARTEKRHSQRFKDFADTGADLFWESDASQKLSILTGEAESASDSLAMTSRVRKDFEPHLKSIFDRQLARSPWPVEVMASHSSFYDVEAKWITPVGDTQVLSISGKPLFDDKSRFSGYRGVGRNITARKQIEDELQQANLLLVEAESRGREQAESALRESERFHRTILDALPLKIAILDTDGTIQAANAAWRELLQAAGIDMANAGIGVNYHQVCRLFSESQQGSIQNIIERIDDVLQSGHKPLSEEYRLNIAGEQCWFAITATSFDESKNRFTVLVHDDISERIHLQERDRKLRAKLAHVSRMNTAGELASGLAHELSQPLTAISHNCDTLLHIAKKLTMVDENIYEIATDIYSQSHRAGEIIRSMRRLIRKDAGLKMEADVNELVRETIGLIQAEARNKSITINLNLAEHLPKPVVDSMQIQQVLINLERNSIESMSSGNAAMKILTISTSLKRDDTIQVTVQDTGSGIDAAIKDRLFSAFLTTKEAGMGLGLSISRTIVEAQGGLIWLDDQCNEQTTIRFTIPINRS